MNEFRIAANSNINNIISIYEHVLEDIERTTDLSGLYLCNYMLYQEKNCMGYDVSILGDIGHGQFTPHEVIEAKIYLLGNRPSPSKHVEFYEHLRYSKSLDRNVWWFGPDDACAEQRKLFMQKLIVQLKSELS